MNTADQLAQIKEIAQNARTTWFGLLALLVFVGVTLMGHKDADFFAIGAATQLPLVNIEVPPVTFFYAAPVLTTALYIYLHVYLAALWPALGQLPIRIDGDPAEERIYPSILTRAGLFLRRNLREEPRLSPQGGGWGSVGIALAMTWTFGQLVLFFLWWRSMPLHSEMLTLWIGFWLWLTLTVGAVSGMNFLLTMAGSTRLNAALLIAALPRRWKAFVLASGAWGLVLVSVIGWLRTEGGFEEFGEDLRITSDLTAQFIPLAQARLAEAELTNRPSDWLDYENWRREYTFAFRTREQLSADQWTWEESQRDKLRAELISRWIAIGRGMDKISMATADFRRANLVSTFLAGADLRWARLDRADLRRAILQIADLRGARIVGANLRSANLGGADLWQAKLTGSDLWSTQLLGAHIAEATFDGASLRSANLADADCREAKFFATLVHSANLKCRSGSLSQNQLEFAVGDESTKLPTGLFVTSCLDRTDLETQGKLPEIAIVTANHSEKRSRFRISRSQFEALLFCREGETPTRIFGVN